MEAGRLLRLLCGTLTPAHLATHLPPCQHLGGCNEADRLGPHLMRPQSLERDVKLTPRLTLGQWELQARASHPHGGGGG